MFYDHLMIVKTHKLIYKVMIIKIGTLKMRDWKMRDRNARVENAGAPSMESCLQKRVSMLSYRRANVLKSFFTD